MKKTFSILLLSCFALYHFGYYVLYFSCRLKIEAHWTARIYTETNGEFEEKILKIPLSIPYMADQEDFQATNTSFEKDGQYFRVIKQRYVKDSLQIVYVADTAKRNLDTTIRQWISSLVQNGIPDKGTGSLLSKVFIKDYTKPQNNLDLSIVSVKEKNYMGFVFLPFENQTTGPSTPPP